MRIDKPFQSYLAGFVFLIAIVCAGHAAAQAWTQLVPSGGPPGIRGVGSQAFNPNTDRMIVFGGEGFGPNGSNVTNYNDVWVLTHADGKGGTPTWTLLNPSGATPIRVGHSVVYDVAHNRMIVFAGTVGSGACIAESNDVWVLSNADGTGGTLVWTQLFPTGGPPTPRYWQSAVYDPASNRMTVFDGYSCATGFTNTNDVWVLSNANGLGGTPVWTPLNPTGTAPAPRDGHSAVYNAAGNRMIVFGGQVEIGNSFGGGNDVWVLANANGVGTPAWTQLNPTGTPPSVRSLHTAVYDLATNRMVVFGGSGGSLLNDTWVLSNADGTGGTPAWTQLAPTGALPAVRWDHSAVYNAANNRMVVFGGISTYSVGALNDTWVLTDANGVNLSVAIDIQPGSTANTFSLHPGTVVGVAILSSATFDAPSMVDKTSLTFGHVGTEASLITCSAKALDMNGDGLKDLICYFDVNKAGFQLGDTVGYLQGMTQLGDAIHGNDMVKITP